MVSQCFVIECGRRKIIKDRLNEASPFFYTNLKHKYGNRHLSVNKTAFVDIINMHADNSHDFGIIATFLDVVEIYMRLLKFY